MLKVWQWKGVVHFGKKGKLAPRYVGQFEILERIGLVAYRLRLHEELNSVHDTFHVLNLKKCLTDANLQVPLNEINVEKTLRFVKQPVEIMDREIKKLKRRKIMLLKVRWNSKYGPEFTWEHEDQMRIKEQTSLDGSCNYRLSTTFKPKEPTFQVALDVLTLTPFYPAFLITASVPVVYMQEFWATVTYRKHHIRFKINKKSYSFDIKTFRNMLLICLKIPRQKFVDPPFEEETLTFIRELSYPGNIKLLSDVKVNTLPQPRRTFRTIINKCLSGKVTGIDTLRLFRAQILWGLYHQEKVGYVYLLWEDLVLQIENKESRKNKYMFYPRFTKVIINHFMSQDQSIPRRNKVDWHMANDDLILTIMRFIPQHEVVQRYGAILPDYLTNPAMKESEAYKTYHDLATGKVQPKPKYVRRSSRIKSNAAPKPSSGKRVKAMAKVSKFGKKKQPALRLETLSDIALTEDEQMKLAIERSKTQLHISQPSGSGAHEGTGVTPGVPDVPTYKSDDEQMSWKSSEEEDDDEIHDANVEGDKMNEEETYAEDEENVLYGDVNINLEGSGTVMTDATLPNVQATQEHKILI
ncbi:hypothetical protein Tco_0344650 [Tanacetum coccineum]